VLSVGFPTGGMLGAFTVDVRNTAAGSVVFNLWEVVGGS
jgi:hypothetical protein